MTGSDGIFEIRIEYESNIYRVLCFFDKGNLVILINSFQKKTQKIPPKEITLAEKLKKQYFIDKKYGKVGTVTRTAFESKAQAFVIGELLKDERLKANLTQEALAEKTGTKKSYISRIENGRADIQLSTLYKLIEQGLNRKLELYIR